MSRPQDPRPVQDPVHGTVLWPLSSGSCSATCISSTLCLGTDGGQTNTGPDVRRHHPGQDDLPPPSASLCLAVWKRPAAERAEPEAARAGAASASASLGGSCCCSYRWGRLGAVRALCLEIPLSANAAAWLEVFPVAARLQFSAFVSLPAGH